MTNAHLGYTKPIVCIIGRPNVGKSTLFNRLIGIRKAVTSEIAGTTRDRLYGVSEWCGRDFILIDTAGLPISSTDDLALDIKSQIDIALKQADLILFMVDGRFAPDPKDIEAMKFLRRNNKKIILVVNKCDNLDLLKATDQFSEFGIDDTFAVSALHSKAIGDLLDRIIGMLPSRSKQELPKAAKKIAIVGRPNTGKSTLVNRILGFERSLVSKIPGTTRDTVDEFFKYKGKDAVLIDTAGIRRSSKTKNKLEYYSILRALSAIDESDVVTLVLDAHEGPVRQDAHIASYVKEQGKKLIVVVNKCDLVKPVKVAIDRFPFIAKEKIFFISAKTGEKVKDLIEYLLGTQATE